MVPGAGATSAWPADWNCFYILDSDWLTLGLLTPHWPGTHTHTHRYRLHWIMQTNTQNKRKRERGRLGSQLMDRQTDVRLFGILYAPLYVRFNCLVGAALNNWWISLLQHSYYSYQWLVFALALIKKSNC